MVPLAFVILTLLGSVAVPAYQTWRITRLLRETNEVLAPARLLVEQLQAGLAKELTALQSFALVGDEGLLDRYRLAATEDERRMAALEALATRLRTVPAEHAPAIRREVDAWRRLNDTLIQQRGSRPQFAEALRLGQARYDAAMSAIADLSSSLAAEAVARDDRVRALERLSIISNAGLVLAALVAAFGVLILTLQERRLTATLHRRVAEESALRRLARALSAAVTTEEALRRAVEGALAATHAAGAYVEWAVAGDEVMAVLATQDGSPAACTLAPRAGSLTEAVAAHGPSAAVAAVDDIDGRLGARLPDGGARYTALRTPLLSADETLGAFVLLRRRTSPPFGEDERRQLRLVSDLASATLRRVDGMAAERRALDEARRRARQEAALRETAEALAGAYTTEEVTQCILRAALESVDGRGAFVEQVAAQAGDAPAMVIVRAVAGRGVPPLDTTYPLAGSYAELVTASDEPLLIADLRHPERSGIFSTMGEPGGSAIVVPLGDGGRATGALFVLSAEGARFGPDDLARAAIFGHLAALAYEKIRLLEEAHERRRVLERVIQSRSRLIRGFSHDVKNPVGAADGFAELLSLGVYGELTVEQRDSVDRMRRCIHGALTLIDELHELARAETGTLALSPQPVDLAELVRAIGEEYHAAAQASGLSLSVEVQPDAPVLETDGARVRQIASNLLSNAIKYTRSGSVQVRALRQSRGPAADAGEWALLQVVDSGPGIPTEQQEFIFEEFSRLGTGGAPGAGLGLAISKTLAQALGGHITVRSEPGLGSTFTLWLPLREAERPV
jgi:signal transduction histidine kinase/CHASE3 domain sensor protein